jgi:hypothetical protein
MGQGQHVVDRRRQPAAHGGTRPHRQHQRLAGARAGAPGHVVADVGNLRRFRPAVAHQGQDGVDHALADRDVADHPLRGDQVGPAHHRLGLGLLGAGGGNQDLPLGVAIRIVDVDLHEEPVELGLGQRVGALLLQRVLGGQHVERRR